MAEIVGIFPHIGGMDLIRGRPHLPLSLIHAFSLASREFDVALVDLRVERDWRAAVARALDDALFAGVSVMSGQPVGWAYQVSRFIKQRSDVPVIWGGIHPTIAPEETLGDPVVDAVVIGEGELTTLEIARRLADRRSLRGVRGLWFKENGNIVRNPAAEPVDLDSMPPPACHLVDVDRYVQRYRGRRTLNLETSRGCRHGCHFCYHAASRPRRGFRALSPARTVERIAWLCDTHGVDGCYLVDDNFFLDRARGMAVAAGLAAIPHGPHWQLQGVDVPSMLQFTPGELALLERSRLDRISVGAESGSDRVLRYVHKPNTRAQIMEANRRWASFDIRIFYSFVSGFPEETPEELRQTIALMFRLLRENPNARVSPIYNFIPYPGTPLWTEVVTHHGFAPPAQLADWRSFDWDHVAVPYLSAAMRARLETFYFPALCMDDKLSDVHAPAWLRLCGRLYRPLGRARMKADFSGWPFERLAARAVSTLLEIGGRTSRPWTV